MAWRWHTKLVTCFSRVEPCRALSAVQHESLTLCMCQTTTGKKKKTWKLINCFCATWFCILKNGIWKKQCFWTHSQQCDSGVSEDLTWSQSQEGVMPCRLWQNAFCLVSIFSSHCALSPVPRYHRWPPVFNLRLGLFRHRTLLTRSCVLSNCRRLILASSRELAQHTSVIIALSRILV